MSGQEPPTTQGVTTKGTEIDSKCYREPDLHLSQTHLTGCLALNASGSDRSLTVHIQLTSPKHQTFYVYLFGIGFNSTPIGGIAMSTISSNGGSFLCKAFEGSHDDGLVTCPYQCKCPDTCSSVVAYINNKMAVSLCKISGWNPLIAANIKMTL